nr:MAG TPA: hypothetical protein [Microviridae sp.]
MIKQIEKKIKKWLPIISAIAKIIIRIFKK